MKQKILIISLLFTCFTYIKGMEQQATDQYWHGLKLDLSQGSINEKDKLGYTQLHWAAIHGNEGNTRQLILGGADLLCKDRTSSTPLDLANLYHHKKVAALIAQALREKGLEK